MAIELQRRSQVLSPGRAVSRPPRTASPNINPNPTSSSVSGASSWRAQGSTTEGAVLAPARQRSNDVASAPTLKSAPLPSSHARQPKALQLRLSELPSRVGNIQADQIGRELGQGDEKIVYRLKPPLDKYAVAAFHVPSDTLNETREALKQLKRMGLPVVDYSDPIIVTVDGRQRQGVYMEYVDGGFSGKDLQTRKDRPAGLHATAQTFADLDAIESKLRNGGQGHGVAVWDLDFLIGQDGRVRLFDPAAVIPVNPVTGRGKSSLHENLKLIADLRALLSNEGKPPATTR